MNESFKTKATFILDRTAFPPARKSYRIGLLTTHKNGDFGAISVTEQSFGATLQCGVNSHSDRSGSISRKKDWNALHGSKYLGVRTRA